MPDEAVIAIVALVLIFGMPLVWIVAHYGYLACKNWQSTRLIREMVVRGYNAQEIIAVCHAMGQKKRKTSSDLSDIPPAKPIRHPAYN